MKEVTKTTFKPRHLSMMSIGGVIGAALFIGSGKTISIAGPSAILAYISGGILVILVMRMLGEMAAAKPDAGSFSTYAEYAIGSWASFTIGWLYWMFWTLVMGWEIYIAGSILNNFLPYLEVWEYSSIISIIFICINFLPVRHFGEFEFWFALIKVIAIILFIVIGISAILYIWPFGTARGFKYLTAEGGFMPNGISSLAVAMLSTMFAFLGAEIVTIAAAESENPQKEIIKATKSVVWRISLFFVGSIFVVVCLVPWNNPLLVSPVHGSYNVTLTALGFKHASYIVNFIVLTSVCSCFNSALYTSSRILFSLTQRGYAPKYFNKMSKKTNIPYLCILGSTIFSFISIILIATSNMDLYDILMHTTGAVALLVYLCIAFSQLKMRKKLMLENKILSIKMWFFPWLTYFVIIFIIVAMIVMLFEGTYFYEVSFTLITAIIIIIIGNIIQYLQKTKSLIKN